MGKQDKLYIAMNLVENYGFNIFDNEGMLICDTWEEAGRACVKKIKIEELEAAKKDLHDYQEMATKDMAALQERINKLQVN